MKVKIKYLVMSSEALNSLYNQELSGDLALSVCEVVKAVKVKLEDYEEVRTKLLNQFGVLNEETKAYEFDSENSEKFKEEFDKLLESDVDLAVREIPKSQIMTIPKVIPAQIDVLDWLIV